MKQIAENSSLLFSNHYQNTIFKMKVVENHFSKLTFIKM